MVLLQCWLLGTDNRFLFPPQCSSPVSMVTWGCCPRGTHRGWWLERVSMHTKMPLLSFLHVFLTFTFSHHFICLNLLFYSHPGTAGVIISLSRIFTKLLINDERRNTLIFFLVSISMEMLCFLLHLLVRRSRFVRYYTSHTPGKGPGKCHDPRDNGAGYRVHHDVTAEEVRFVSLWAGSWLQSVYWTFIFSHVTSLAQYWFVSWWAPPLLWSRQIFLLWIALKFCRDIYNSWRMNPTDFSNPFPFLLASPWGSHYAFNVLTLIPTFMSPSWWIVIMLESNSSPKCFFLLIPTVEYLSITV